MSDEIHTYYPETIEEGSFPLAETTDLTTTQESSGGTYSNTETKETPMPTKRVAVELLSSALNTRSKKILAEFEFTKQGAIQIGEYTNGVSGDLRISPSGIVARNLSGITTFTLDGDTGDAYFAGTIQAGTVIGGAVAVGDGDILIDGESKRMIFYDDDGIPSIVIGNV